MLSVMCRLHDDTPSLIRVWFLELWEGCAVYAHKATSTIPQGGTGIDFKMLRLGDWVLVLG